MDYFRPNYAAAGALGLASTGTGTVEEQLLAEQEKRRKATQQVFDVFGTRTPGKDQSQIAPGAPAAWQALGIR